MLVLPELEALTRPRSRPPTGSYNLVCMYVNSNEMFRLPIQRKFIRSPKDQSHILHRVSLTWATPQTKCGNDFGLVESCGCRWLRSNSSKFRDKNAVAQTAISEQPFFARAIHPRNYPSSPRNTPDFSAMTHMQDARGFLPPRNVTNYPQPLESQGALWPHTFMIYSGKES